MPQIVNYLCGNSCNINCFQVKKKEQEPTQKSGSGRLRLHNTGSHKPFILAPMGLRHFHTVYVSGIEYAIQGAKSKLLFEL